MQRVDAQFYTGSPQQVAQRLLGQLLVRKLANGTRLSGIVVEVEAYLSSHDAASHSFKGPRKSNASMFGAAGTLYVYPIHSRHCLNVVTEPAKRGSAVLIRAVEPVEGLQTMARLRGMPNWGVGTVGSYTQWLRRLTSGPGRLCQALNVTRELDAIDLCQSEHMWFEPAPIALKAFLVRTTGRIGLSQARDLQLRLFIDGQQMVSGCARDHSRGRTWRFLDRR
ncbi:MAG: DNA-3-methyladenine glycosylase [Pirellulaceae bacterium]